MVWESFLTRAPLVNVAREKLLESEWEKLLESHG